MRGILLGTLLLSAISLFAQDLNYGNASQKLLASDDKLTIGGYGQIDYNQPVNQESFQTGTMDVHRLVLLFGYNFSDKTQFVTEIEMEHVKELYVEQAWLNHRVSNGLNFRGGLMLIPMGIINEYHEPTTYNGVERPNVDKYIVPTTWREIGAGINGNLIDYGINYQLYLFNGFNGYNGSAKLNGKNALRSGRQKGAESFISSPNLSFKTEWNSMNGLKIGLSGYFGKTQSELFDGLAKDDPSAIAMADSSVVGINMVGFDTRYQLGNFSFTGQYIFSHQNNTEAYNKFTGSDLGSAIHGWYIEGAYALYLGKNDNYRLTPFVRYENYNTHLGVDNYTTQNLSYNRTDLTMGVSFHLSQGAVLKADYQLFSNAGSDQTNGQLNLGIGIWF